MTFVKKNNSTRFLKSLANLSFAISLLFLIGLLIALGTFIEQDQSLSFYQSNYPTTNPLFGFLDWRFITVIGLDRVYSAPWFIVVLFVFASSLMTCTFTTQLPSLKKFKLWNFLNNNSQIERFDIKSKLPRNLTNLAIYQVYVSNYHIFRQNRKNYAYIGLLGRIGPIAVHFSILLLLLGTTFGSLSGYNIQEIVPRGEIFHLQNLVRSGPLTRTASDASIRVNDFWITYTQELKTNQFYSDLSVIGTNGQEIKRKIIFVNEPFQYRELTIYQTDWDINGVKIQLNNSPPIQIPLKKINRAGRKFWLGSTTFNQDENKQLVILVNDLKGDIYFYDNKGSLFSKAQIGQTISLDKSNTLRVVDFLTSTGLQIKEDLGLSLVYFSFFLIMISVYISFFSYSQIWGLENSENFLISGKSNRAILDFQEQFKKLFRNI
uniref:c-type cytochrome biogenensis protein n=1 Tax=Ochrosphaera neapolitana TaxID=35137 RepID=UPI00286C6C33|nr:c-type cytochrome biogenensis protein [Ochrosphaera neapolitana]WKK50106.1 c-type cytochrome biogenensis protein [Ochrosphaera neapolitana]